MGRDGRSWNDDQLRRAVRRWEERLAAEGKSELTIRTYVRDANAFLDDLTGRSHTNARRPRTSIVHAQKTVSLAPSALVPVPRELRRLYEAWNEEGRPRQRPIRWPRDRWVAMLPEHEAFFDSLPDCVDRVSVRRIARGAGAGQVQAVNALLAVVTWGMGDTGNGPWRANQMLTCRPDAPACLRGVALTLGEDGPVAAYSRLAGDSRLEYLGPSFGTKYLALCQAPGAPLVALIHDDLIRAWMKLNGRQDLAAAYYSVRVYEAYLAQMLAWADAIGTDPETTEWLIFQAESKKRGNQWARANECP